MPKPVLKTNRIIRSPQVLDAFITFLRPRLPLDLQHTRITADELVEVLAYASVNRVSIEATSVELENVPSANRLREVLAAALPDRVTLQRALNMILRQQLPRCLLKGKRSYTVAIDLTLIPYHGQPQRDKAEVVRGAPLCAARPHAGGPRRILAVLEGDSGAPAVRGCDEPLDL